MKLVTPSAKKSSAHLNARDSDSETENTFVARTSIPVETNTTASKTTPINSPNMVTGVLNDSTNQPTKRPKQQRSLCEQAKDRPSTSRLLFAPQRETLQPPNMLPLPKALTASLPVFDGKSEKFELFEDLIICLFFYLYTSELFIHQKVSSPHWDTEKIYFHSLLRGNALQAYCNLENIKKDIIEKVITVFKRRFGFRGFPILRKSETRVRRSAL